MRTRVSILSFGVCLLALPALTAQVPDAKAVPYPLNVKPSTPQGTLTGVPVMPSKALPVTPPSGSDLPFANTAPVKPQTRVFAVADLVHAPLVIPGAAALENTKAAHAQTLMKMIVALTKPESWERGGGTGAIQFIAASDSLCVTNAPDVLAEAQKLIEGLRRMQDRQVSLEVQLVTVPAGFGAKAGWPTTDDKGKTTPKLSTPEEVKKAVAEMKGDKRVELVSNPKMTLFDGQAGLFHVLQNVEVPGTSGGSVQTVGSTTVEIGTKFECLPTVSLDGKTIALKLNTSHSALTHGGVSTVQNRSSVAVPCGNTAIVHLGSVSAEERIESKLPALSKVPYLERLFHTVGVRTVERDVYQIVTVRIIKETDFAPAIKSSDCVTSPCCKSSCGIEVAAQKPVDLPKHLFSTWIGWFGAQ